MGKEVKWGQRNSKTLKYGGSALSCCWFGRGHAEPSLAQPNLDDGYAMLREASDGMWGPSKDHAVEPLKAKEGSLGFS